ncbi:MAG: Crp/Fnr family transcriptional regulator [Rhodomicrobium sp.]|nr:Crp/Fnr family transcriptional regulator [Rhodomicrobium sp.]
MSESRPQKDGDEGPPRSILDGLPPETLKRIQKGAAKMTFAKGQEIIARSDELSDVFILMSGSARVIVFSASGKAVSFRRIDPGDLFGEFAAIDGDKRSASVEALEASMVLSMTARFFREMMETDRAFMRAVLNHLVGLLRSMTSRIVEFSTLPVTNRIHCELLRMVRPAGDGSGEYEIDPAPTHLEIAGRISTHREAVSREISRLKHLGVIERRGRALVVLDIARLERMVQEANGE